VTLAPQDGLQLARIEVTLADGSIEAAEADRRDRQIPTIETMARKLRTLARGRWPAATAESVIGFVTGPAEQPVARLSAHLRT